MRSSYEEAVQLCHEFRMLRNMKIVNYEVNSLLGYQKRLHRGPERLSQQQYKQACTLATAISPEAGQSFVVEDAIFNAGIRIIINDISVCTVELPSW